MAGVKIAAAASGGSAEIAGPPSSSANTVLKLPADTGSAGQVLKVKSANHSATNAELEWAADSGGKILQVVKGSEITDQISTTSTTYADTGTTVTITPSSASNTIWVIASGDTWVQGTGYNAYGGLRLMRDTTQLMECWNTYDSENSSFAARISNPHCMQIVDSPNTTSAVVYKVQYCILWTNYSATFKYPGRDDADWYKNAQITAMEVAA
jgi:hypothetical protein